MSKTEVKTVTCYGCPLTACFVKAHIEDGKLVKVTPDWEKVCIYDCPRGFLDNDGQAGIEYHYMDKRVNYPMKRVGKRGENKWERISWDQALDEIAEKLQYIKETYSPHAMSVNCGTAHHSDNNWVPWRFHSAFGSVNKGGHEQICYGPSQITGEHTFGWPLSIFAPPGVEPKSAILIGNCAKSIPMLYDTMKELREDGCKIIGLDPVNTPTTNIADIWMQERPGTDIAIWLCWIREMIKNEWYDKEFMLNWSNAPFLVRTDTNKMLKGSEMKAGLEDCYVVWNTATNAPAIWDADARKYHEDGVTQAMSGAYSVTLADGNTVECKTAWDLLKEGVEEWTAEKASEITWVPADKILAACEMFATNTPNLFLVTGHTYDTYSPGASAVCRCKDIIIMMTGSVDRTEMVTGCYDVENMVSIYNMELRPDEVFSAEDKAKLAGHGKFSALTFDGYDLKAKYEKKFWGTASNAMWSCQYHPQIMFRDIIEEKNPDRVRAMILSGSNPLIKYSNVKLVYEAMKKLDLIVAAEFVMTPSAELADYVLPMSDWFERPEIGPSLPCENFNFTHITGAAMEPEFERRNDYDFFKGLADRLGFGGKFPWKDLTECYNWRMKGVLEKFDCKDINEFGEEVGFHYPDPVSEQYKEKGGFGTMSGKAELWSLVLETLGYDALPKYAEPSLSPINAPELAEEYPMILIGIDRHLPMYHTMFFEVPSLRRMHQDPSFKINSNTARRSDPPINDGDWVWIETRLGRIKQRAKLIDGIHPNVIKASHHWWFPEQPAEEPYLHGMWKSNINVVLEDDPELCDPVFGSWVQSALPCKVYKATEAAHLEEDRT